jgi:steroid delta-isomerase-like uncharacterized protein
MAQQTTATQGPVDRAWLDDFLARWEEAWDSHDVDRVLAHMTDDIVYEDSAWPRQMRGHADVREFLEYVWTGMPDAHFEAIDGPYLHTDEPKVSFYWRGTGTNTGRTDPPGLAPTGKSIEFYGADFHEYRDGKVARLRIVFDMADLMRKYGVLPAAGSREERMMAKATNLRGRFSRGR